MVNSTNTSGATVWSHNPLAAPMSLFHHTHSISRILPQASSPDQQSSASFISMMWVLPSVLGTQPTGQNPFFRCLNGLTGTAQLFTRS